MAVGDYELLPFTTPVRSPPTADDVRGNDEKVRRKFVAHQADTVAHLQSGPVASRPSAPAEGTVWVATDMGAEGIAVYANGGWVNL